MEAIVAVSLVVVFSSIASADQGAAGVQDAGGSGTRIAGAAGEGEFSTGKGERLVASICREDAEDLMAGACRIPILPSDPVVGLIAVLELLAKDDGGLGTRKAAQGGDA